MITRMLTLTDRETPFDVGRRESTVVEVSDAIW